MRPRLALLGGGRRRRGLEPHGLRDLLDRGSLGVAHALAGEAHEALADRPAALRKGDVHARARWALEDCLPLLVGEVCFGCHALSFVARNAANISCEAELRELHGHRDLNEERAMATEQKTQAQDGSVATAGADTLSV